MGKYHSIRKHELIKLRSIQQWAFSVLCFPMHNIYILSLNVTCSLVGVISFVLFKFYYLERYHLYGCRMNYSTGFPVICAPSQRPRGADFSSIMTIFVGLSFLVLNRVITIHCMLSHWKCSLAQETRHNVFNALKGHNDATSCKTYNLLCRLEEIPSRCSKKNCPYMDNLSALHLHIRRTFRYLSSYIISELYLSHHYKKWPKFVVICCLLSCTFLLPVAFFIGEDSSLSIAMGICLLLFYTMPVASIFMILFCLPFLVYQKDTVSMITLVTFFCWCITLTACLIVSIRQENKDEHRLVKDIYKKKLSSEEDAKLCMSLYGYGKWCFCVINLYTNVRLSCTVDLSNITKYISC